MLHQVPGSSPCVAACSTAWWSLSVGVAVLGLQRGLVGISMLRIPQWQGCLLVLVSAIPCMLSGHCSSDIAVVSQLHHAPISQLCSDLSCGAAALGQLAAKS